MDRRPWLDRVDCELARRGVPARGRRRLIAEWRDHLDDLMEEGISMTATETKMGDPAEVAAGAAEQYRRAGWVRRHPLLTFGLTPLPLILMVFVGCVLLLELLALAAVYLLYDDPENLPRPMIGRLMFALSYAVRFLPFALLAVWFTRLYLRSGVRRGWYLAALGQVLFVAGSVISVIKLSDEPGQSHWVLGLAWMAMPTGDGWVMPFLPMLGWAQAAQLAVPVVAAGLLLALARRRERQLTVA